jgi:hypothetical protein
MNTSSDQRLSRRRWLWWILAAVVGTPVTVYALAIAYLFIVPSAEDYGHRAEFDAGMWRDRSLDTDPQWPTRLRMVDDLIAKKQLDEMARGQVASLLGPGDQTDKWKDWDLVYYLGPERGAFGIDSEWLVIRFDASGRVATYRIVRD